MNCFTHEDRPAVGVCKQCYKAVCRECVTIAAGAVTCSAPCAAEVARVDAQVGTLLNAAPRTRTGNVVVYVGMGVLMLLVGALMHDAAGAFIAFMGVLMFVGAYFQGSRARTNAPSR